METPRVQTCEWFISREVPECGEVAPYTVTLTGLVTKATVHLCVKHKKIHDESFARRRTERRQTTH